MKIIEKEVSIRVFTWSELENINQELFHKAIKARQNAQAPYSHYKVGCAILSDTGRIFTGVNVERCSWTQTTHAEQNAVDTMIAEQGISRILRVAVVGSPEDQEISLVPRSEHLIEQVDQVCPSCGHCLQIIGENCFDKNGRFDPSVLLMGSHNGEFYVTTIGDAWPMPFPPQHLGVNYVQIAKQQIQK